jgi:hypothetical protein
VETVSNRVEANSLELNGFEDVFDVDAESIQHGASTVVTGYQHSAEHGAGMTLKAASVHLKVGISTLRAKIKAGEIAAVKIQGPHGPEWSVFPSCSAITGSAQQGAQQGVDTVTNTPQAGSHNVPAVDVNRLLDMIADQSKRLEDSAATIGYLRAELNSSKETIKLLEDRKVWWRKAWHWFLGKSVQ